MSPISSLAHGRHLPGSIMEGIEGLRTYWNQILTEPPETWSGRQWIFAVFLLLTFFWCCGCLGCNYRRRRAYYGRGNNGNGYYGNGGGYYGHGYPMMGGGYQGGWGQPYYRRSSGGMGDCIRNLICCFCCYEYFCADCAHVPCFRHSSFGGGESSANAMGVEESYTEMV